MSTPSTGQGSKPSLIKADYGGTDSETEDKAMLSDQESSAHRSRHHHYHHHHHHHYASSANKPAAGLRFKVVRYEEYRQKWGTKGKASVWDEHLPGVPTSLPPKSEIELKNEQNLLPHDEELLAATSTITFPHQHCHQHPVLSKRSHYERIALKMIHYPKCDQARKPNANGKVEVSKIDDDRQQSPSRRSRRRKQKQSGPGSVAANNATPAPLTQSQSPQEVTPNSNSTATVAAPSNSEEPLSLFQTEPESRPSDEESVQQALSEIEIDPCEDTEIPNPPTSPVPSDIQSQMSDIQSSSVKKGRFTVSSHDDNSGGSTVSQPPLATEAVTPPSAHHLHSIEHTEREASRDVSQNARDVALVCRKYQPQIADLFSPENVQAAFNWISHFRSSQVDSDDPSVLQAGLQMDSIDQGAIKNLSLLNSDDANFQVTLDNITQAVIYLTSQEKSQKPSQFSQHTQTIEKLLSSTKPSHSFSGLPSSSSNVVAPANHKDLTAVSATGAASSTSTSTPQPVTAPAAPANGPSTTNVASRLESCVHGVTDKFQEVLVNALKSEVEPLTVLIQQYKAAISQRDAEITSLNQQLRTFLSDESYQQNLSRQSKLPKLE